MSGRQCTRARDEKLDIILMATEWEEQFPLSNVIALTRDISDHTPLLFNTGDSSSNFNQCQFKFELGWLLPDSLMDMVKEAWENVDLGSTLMERWQAKIR